MRIERNLRVPTGNILVVYGEHGLLEMLSLGDYGKQANIKCYALGLDREIEKVVHGPMLPLEEKWVITVSTQYGCSMGCQFCSPAGTLVNTPFGRVPIELLNTGDMVLGYNLDANAVRINQIDEIGSREVSGELVEIELANGETLRVTPDHPIILSDGRTVIASNIQTGDDVIEFV